MNWQTNQTRFIHFNMIIKWFICKYIQGLWRAISLSLNNSPSYEFNILDLEIMQKSHFCSQHSCGWFAFLNKFHPVHFSLFIHSEFCSLVDARAPLTAFTPADTNHAHHKNTAEFAFDHTKQVRRQNTLYIAFYLIKCYKASTISIFFTPAASLMAQVVVSLSNWQHNKISYYDIHSWMS